MAIQNVSGVGTIIQLVAMPTIPYGVKIEAFPGDADPIESAQLTTADFTMGVNGDLILNRRANPVNITIRTVPGTEEDIALERLFDANRVAANKVSYLDIITMTFVYSTGITKVLTNGAIISGTPIIGISSNGMMKTRQWGFIFEGKTL